MKKKKKKTTSFIDLNVAGIIIISKNNLYNAVQ